ncbi:MAG TPA: hypothetical protein VJ772_09635 [Nitrososphaeraceae archaeon]|jgi:hypothetical protein|nr:hypothetical protein [Nitrososphaeraceae archaeon]
MAGRIIALIAISSIIFLVSAIHGNVYGSLITSDNGVNTNQVLRYYTTASLIDNQSSNKEIMIVLKSQLEDSDPFKSQSSNNEGNALNLTSTEDAGPFDRRSNDVNSIDVNSNDDKECEFNCVESTPMRDNIPFELPSIPFP